MRIIEWIVIIVAFIKLKDYFNLQEIMYILEKNLDPIRILANFKCSFIRVPELASFILKFILILNYEIVQILC